VFSITLERSRVSNACDIVIENYVTVERGLEIYFSKLRGVGRQVLQASSNVASMLHDMGRCCETAQQASQLAAELKKRLMIRPSSSYWLFRQEASPAEEGRFALHEGHSKVSYPLKTVQ
jgi:hypothetical protein